MNKPWEGRINVFGGEGCSENYKQSTSLLWPGKSGQHPTGAVVASKTIGAIGEVPTRDGRVANIIAGDFAVKGFLALLGAVVASKTGGVIGEVPTKSGCLANIAAGDVAVDGFLAFSGAAVATKTIGAFGEVPKRAGNLEKGESLPRRELEVLLPKDCSFIPEVDRFPGHR